MLIGATLQPQRGASLLEVMVAASLGLLVVLAVQQTWAWQMAKQGDAGKSTAMFLTAQSLIEQISQDVSAADPSLLELNGPCFLVPQHDGRMLAYRLQRGQIQRHTLAPYCPASGWQSLSHYHAVAIESLTMEQIKGTGLPTLLLSLTARSNRSDEGLYVFNREVVLDAAP